jgi:hypothetical protein
MLFDFCHGECAVSDQRGGVLNLQTLLSGKISSNVLALERPMETGIPAYTATEDLPKQRTVQLVQWSLLEIQAQLESKLHGNEVIRALRTAIALNGQKESTE